MCSRCHGGHRRSACGSGGLTGGGARVGMQGKSSTSEPIDREFLCMCIPNVSFVGRFVCCGLSVYHALTCSIAETGELVKRVGVVYR